jgi:hypothetical protein
VTAEELQQVKQMVLRDLPQVLEQDPGFAVFIEGLLSEKFPRRDEFARLLDEVQASRRENQERFEGIDQRMDRMENRMDEQFQRLSADIHGLRHWMEVNVGNWQTRAGRRMEDVVAGAFCYGLDRGDIRPEHVKLRQKITDPQGLVYRPGKTREVDILAVGPELIVFEVKSTADEDDIDDLADKVKLMTHLNPGKQVQGVLVMLGADTEHRRLCAERGLKLIP